MQPKAPTTYSRPGQVAKRMGISLPTLWRWVRTRPDFPKPRKVGERVTLFIDAEIDAFIEGSELA